MHSHGQANESGLEAHSGHVSASVETLAVNSAAVLLREWDVALQAHRHTPGSLCICETVTAGAGSENPRTEPSYRNGGAVLSRVDTEAVLTPLVLLTNQPPRVARTAGSCRTPNRLSVRSRQCSELLQRLQHSNKVSCTAPLNDKRPG